MEYRGDSNLCLLMWQPHPQPSKQTSSEMKKPILNVNLPKVLLSSTSLNKFGDNIKVLNTTYCPKEPFYIGKQKFNHFNKILITFYIISC